jgi:hypothetical protein
MPYCTWSCEVSIIMRVAVSRALSDTSCITIVLLLIPGELEELGRSSLSGVVINASRM